MEGWKVRPLLEALGNFGRTADGGIDRLLFTPAYEEAAAYLLNEMKKIGLECWRDTVGNIHGVLSAKEPGAKTVYLGSHLDTVKGGGLYDGALGVAAAVEVVRVIKEEGLELPYHLHILATNGEEGNDLGGTFGSRCLMGLVNVDQPGYLNIAAGFGLKRKDILAAKLDTKNAACYLELHIEQGKTLEETGEDIGVVTGIVGLRRYGITVEGEANHSGTTMMSYRRDAMTASAKLIAEADEIVRTYGDQMVATVGKFQMYPNSVAVIPGKTEFVLEMRSLQESMMEKYYAQVQLAALKLTQVDVKYETVVEKSPVDCDVRLIKLMTERCKEANISYRQMSSGATHDGNAFALKMPIGMLFVPSHKGISHNKAEYTPWEQCELGTQLLYETVKELLKQKLF